MRPCRDHLGARLGPGEGRELMKAIRVHAYGQPPRVDDVPEPEAPGPDDVVVRIGGAGLCRPHPHIIDGWFADTTPADPPPLLGHQNPRWGPAAAPPVADPT